jgi:1-deoxy-D-xylulose-5-phosphate synthase
LLEKSTIPHVKVKRLGIPDEFVEHGHPGLLRSKYKLDAPGIVEQVLSLFPELAAVPATRKH